MASEGSVDVLLDTRCYIDKAGRRNATTATAITSCGQPIEVTFHTARPPLTSRICVHFPGLGSGDLRLTRPPKVIAAEADLLLLRVCLNPEYWVELDHGDYFVYRARARPHRPSLDLLPRRPPVRFRGLPRPSRNFFNADRVALLPLATDEGDGGDYIVAALTSTPLNQTEFVLDLYRCKGEGQGWVSKVVRVEEPLRDTLCPLPPHLLDDAPLYHETRKAITLGGPGGTVGWVDLWRGILLCDLLDENPVLRDMPLPPPARGNSSKYLKGSPYYIRDIAVSQHKDSIKYVEMEIQPSTTKATTWSMPIPVCSWHDWRLDCSVDVASLNIKSFAHTTNILSKMSSDEEVTEATTGHLFMAYPTLSIDGDAFYFLLGTHHMDLEAVVAVDARKGILREVAKLDSTRNFTFGDIFFSSEISKYLNKTTSNYPISVLAETRLQVTHEAVF